MPREFIPGHHDPDIPSNTLGYFFREALRRLWVSKRTSLAAIAMITISLLILGGFLLVAENLRRAVVQWETRSRVTVYLTVDATPDQIGAIERFLASDPNLTKRRFVSREEALRRFKEHFSNMSSVISQLDENPFPPSFEVDIAPELEHSPVFAFRMADLEKLPGVEQVQFDWEWLRRLDRLIRFLNIAGILAGGILALAAAFTIANVIRLTMLLYREEIEIMRLVGATETIIRGPFLVEGLLQGTIGAVIAISILFGAFTLAAQTMAPANSMLWSFLFVGFLSWQKIAALVLGGMAAGYLGSWITVRNAER